MLAMSMVLNLAVLIPLCAALLRNSPAMEEVYGPDCTARRILICLYIAIAVASAAILAGLALNIPEIGTLALPVLALQIIYKLLTWPMVGTANIVVRFNLAIAAFHAATFAALIL